MKTMIRMQALGLLAAALCACGARASAPVARMGDTSVHGGTVVMGLPTVLVNGQAIARVGDNHVCPALTGLVPHVGGPIMNGSGTVFAGGLAVAAQGSSAFCVGPIGVVAQGSPNVLVGGLPFAAPSPDPLLPLATLANASAGLDLCSFPAAER